MMEFQVGPANPALNKFSTAGEKRAPYTEKLPSLFFSDTPQYNEEQSSLKLL